MGGSVAIFNAGDLTDAAVLIWLVTSGRGGGRAGSGESGDTDVPIQIAEKGFGAGIVSKRDDAAWFVDLIARITANTGGGGTDLGGDGGGRKQSERV